MAKRPDWSRPLPAALHVLDERDKPILTLATAGDVRELIVKRLQRKAGRKAHGSMSPASRSMPRTAATVPTCRSGCAWC
jgi:hypothetical protein